MKRIIDNRKKEKFMIDDEYLNGMARLVGHQGTLVYFSLCRHANRDQECFPSIKLMSEELLVSTDTIKRGIKKLKERNVIDVGKKRTKGGTWLNNSYTLKDKSVWDYNQGANSTVANQGAKLTSTRVQNSPHQGANSTTKETHKKETHIKELQTEVCGKEVNELLCLFEEVNPTINYGNKTIRKDLEEMLLKFGKEKLINTIKYAISVQGNKYTPTITTPTQLKNKLGELMIYYKKENANKPIDITNL